MKRILALILSLAVAGQLDAAPKEKNEHRKGAKASAGASGVATQRSVTARTNPQAVRSFQGNQNTQMSSDRARVNVESARSSNIATTRSDAAIRSRSIPSQSSRVITSQPSSNRYTTTRDRDWDRNRDRDWDRDRNHDRDWDGDRRYRGRLSYDVYRNWNRGRIYSWNNDRYHWYNGSWVIYDASPTVVYSESLPMVGASVVASVQAELLDRGYNPGPADGVMGSRTRSAIAEFQNDRGLSVTGTINSSLLSALDLN